jgi:hypothetical protein
MTRLKFLLSFFMLLGLALSSAPVAAQDDVSALDDPSQFEGIESAVSRSWSVDFETMMMASPEAEMDEGGIVFLSAEALQFDTDENASTAYNVFLTEGVSSLSTGMDMEDEEAEITEQEIDLGDEGYQVDLVSTSDEGMGAFRVTFARDGNLVFVVFAITGDLESASLATDLLDYMVNEGEPGDGEGTVNEDGTSEGGLWDVFPPADHPALEGLISGDDELLYPAP